MVQFTLWFDDDPVAYNTFVSCVELVLDALQEQGRLEWFEDRNGTWEKSAHVGDLFLARGDAVYAMHTTVMGPGLAVQAYF